MIAGLQIVIINSTFPNIGHDFRYIIPRLVDTHLFYAKNGIAVQWWTPFLGGGLPSFPNPNQMQFSPLQMLTLFFNPYIACLLSAFIYSIIGFLGSYFLASKIFKIDHLNSILYSLLFATTGMYIQYNLIGAVTYNCVQFYPMLSYLTLKDKNRFFNVLIISVLLTINLFSSGVYLQIVFPISIFLMILLHSIYFRKGLGKPQLYPILTLFSGSIISVIIASSKLYSGLTFMKFFPRIMSFDFHQISTLKALWGLLMQFFYPKLALMYRTPAEIGMDISSNMALNNWSSYPWCLDNSFSPIIFIIILLALINNDKILSGLKSRISIQSGILSFLFLLISWFLIGFIIGKLPFYEEIKSFPFLKSISDPNRFANVFYLPTITIVTIVWMKTNISSARKNILTWIFILVTILNFYICYSYTAKYYIVEMSKVGIPVFNPKVSIRTWKAINKNPDKFKVEANAPIPDFLNISNNASSIYVYESIFNPGDFRPKLHFGYVTDIDSGRYNITNPASLVYPDENNLKLWDRVQVADSLNFKNFINQKPTTWKISNTQSTLNLVSLATFYVVV
ncbi:MAG: hypothetical protein K2Q22_10430, partial [Cytophagales bacterium]|nr:hypothetical protein [Cytophagales bacterium]